jgi:predicted nucleotidyltransferase
MHIFCKWGCRYNEHTSEVLEVKYIEQSSAPSFRKCTICGKVQEYKYDSNSFYWETISRKRKEIVLNKLFDDSQYE